MLYKSHHSRLLDTLSDGSLRSIAYAMQVLNTEQWATLIVHCYPFFCNLETILESIAQASGDPPMSAVLESARHDAMTEDWQALDLYLADITKKQHAESIPLYRSQASAVCRSRHSALTSLSCIHEMLL